MTVAEWTWGDEGLLRRISSVLAPQARSLEETLSELEAQLPAAGRRPVVVLLQGPEDGSGRRRRTQRMSFQSAEAAVAGVKAFAALTSSAEPGSEAAVSLASFLRQAHGIVQGQLALNVRWRWDDVGLTEVVPWYRTLADLNPGRWTEQKDLKSTKLELAEHTKTQDANRPVALEFHVAGCESTALTFSTAEAAVAGAVARLDELVALQGTLLGRDDFPTSSQQDEYEQYTHRVMQDNGGCVGAYVRFSSPDSFLFVAKGAEGVIESFAGINSFKVDWGSHTASVSMRQCTLIVTADARLSLNGASVEAVSSSMMQAATAKMRSSSDPQAFERLSMRLMERHRIPNAGAIAARSGLCEAVVEVMNKDRESSPHRSVQHTGCLLLWWVCSHDGADSDARTCRARAVEAGALAVAVQAQRAFPEEGELLALVRRLLGVIVQGNKQRRQMALAAGAEEEWLG